MQGYIHDSDNTQDKGFITCCSGSCLAKFWRFSFSDCDSDLEKRLREKNVTGIPKGQCPPPSGVIKVSFKSKIVGTTNVADDVSEL
ncbi:MAG TPA: hypothetical protein VF297_01770 [Pyrinomonadaceae bacterium]